MSIEFENMQNATHPIYVVRVSDLNVDLMPLKNKAELSGSLSLRGRLIAGCLPPRWSPAASMLAAMGSSEPWVLMPMAALEANFEQKQRWHEPRPPVDTIGVQPALPPESVDAVFVEDD